MTPPMTRTARSRAAATLGALGGSSRTAAQTEARRRNGKNGGRPVRLHTVGGVVVHHEAVLAGWCGECGDDRPALLATTPAAAQWLRRRGWRRDEWALTRVVEPYVVGGKSWVQP